MSANTLKAKWNQVPTQVKQFLLKASIVLVVWKAIYLGFLAPARTLDGPLTYSVATLTTKALNLYTHSGDYTSKNETRLYRTNDGGTGVVAEQGIYYRGKALVFVEDACNGLELFVLYIALILLLPAATRYKVLYTVLGVLAIYTVNVFRCAMVAYMEIYYPAHVDFAHHYVFAFIVYAFIIALWLSYSNKVSFAGPVKHQ